MNINPKFENAAVKKVFETYPIAARVPLLRLRQLIFATASATVGVGEIEETLKWGEPAYLTTASKSGSTIRIAWNKKSPNQFGLYFNCKSNLLDTFRSLFPHQVQFEADRAIIFALTDELPEDILRICIGIALTYHQRAKQNANTKPPKTKTTFESTDQRKLVGRS